MKYGKQFLPGLVITSLLVSSGGAQTTPPKSGLQSTRATARRPALDAVWQSPAQLRHSLIGGTPGTLRADSQGLEFVPTSGQSKQWSVTEMKGLDLRPHRLVLTGYDNRRWHMPKLQQFNFTFTHEMTPATAALLADEINKPIQNRVPSPDVPAIAVIAVRRNRHLGGSNGLLRIRQQGIDYVTAAPGQSRSWRWLDLQTLSHPDPYHLFVFGYLDSYAFELKQALSRDVFNHLSDEIWSHNESAVRDGPVSPPPGAPTSERPEER